MSLEIRALDGTTKRLEAEVLATFARGFAGRLLRDGDAGYDEARRVWNGMIDRRPALIARCTGTADVARAVQFARDQRLLVSVKGGGHNIAGLAVCEAGLVIDLSPLRGVWVDPAARTARAQAGCLLGDLDRETQVHGLAAVLGLVTNTGIAGLTVGGGFGYLTRRHGFTCDTLVSMEVVMADGSVVRAADDENAELFWSLRGGGGNFGIVTSFEYRLFPVGPEVVGGAVAWRGEDAPQVLRMYRDIARAAPRELTCMAALRLAPVAPWLPKPMHGKPLVAIFMCHTGVPEQGEQLVAPIRAFGRPVADTVARRPYTQMQSLFDATQPPGRRYYFKSEYFRSLESGLLDALVEHAGRLSSPDSALQLLQLEGALNELPADHSPVGNRDAAFVLSIGAGWDAAEDDAHNIAWARDCWQAVRPFSTGGVYLNFLTEEEGADRIEAAYGKQTLDRLATIKRKLDPQNLFRHTKSVLPAE